MPVIDWILMALPIAFVIGVAIYTRRFVRSVADFLAGGRCAGRYLLANARGESDAGLTNTMSKFEVILVSGFVLNFWDKVAVPVMLLIGISGFVIYRFRETRALTLAQFFEVRYSARFRLFMGILAFVSGILNYGIFPAVSSRFFIYFMGLPQTVTIAGFHVATFMLIMAAYLSCTLVMVLIGGQVTAMVTDCVEGILSHFIYIIIAIAVLFIVHWRQIVQVMEAAPQGHSLIDPFDTSGVEDFNIWFVAVNLAMFIYTRMALQNKQGFNAAARNAHESRMGDVLGNWRTYARNLMLLLLGVCALTFLRHPAFAEAARPVHEQLKTINDVYTQKQMTVPIALRYLLPDGIRGLFASIMMMGLLAGDAGHMHSWGSIFVQDVMLPLRKTPLSPRGHIWALRVAVFGVALFAFLFSVFFTQTQYIALWWTITAGVFTAGAGAAIIGGLYWRFGTTAGAWAGALVGSVLCAIGILLSTGWNWIVASFGEDFIQMGFALPQKFWLNFQWTSFISAVAAASVYVIVSLLTCRAPYNLDRMLHRGVYSVEAGASASPTRLSERFSLRAILRFDSNFSRADKWVSAGIFWFAMALLSINLIVTSWNKLLFRWPVEWWANYWLVTTLILPFVIALATLVWFTIGGVIDMREFFRALRQKPSDSTDDGRVMQPVSPSFPVVPRTEEKRV